MTRTILITGASRGIGRASAIELARNGFDIVIHYNRGKLEAESLLKEINALGVKARTLQFDVGDANATRTAIEKDIAENGAYWGILSNAGLARDGAFPALSEADWSDVINVDLNGFFNVVQPAIMPMLHLKDGGRIIAMSSVSGIMGNRGQVNYSAAKAGLIGAVKALAVELGRRRITVNCIAPGMIETEMLKIVPEAYDAAMSMIPMRRTGKPEEVAALVAFLMSDKASYITRQVISINGGMV
mgnify:CR=1 FL=1